MLIRVAGGAIAVVMAFVVGLSVLVAVVLDGTDDAQAATTSTSAPTGPNAEWDPGLILSGGLPRLVQHDGRRHPDLPRQPGLQG